jgi:N-acetylglucosaminyldiphosphoundecaprenol N-acetyl-beta-D-mannosaminyltransferase
MSDKNNRMDRNVWCVCGLPFDAVNMAEAIGSINSSVKSSKPCFISTPNLNFLIESQKDEKFRNSLINSDLSIGSIKGLSANINLRNPI